MNRVQLQYVLNILVALSVLIISRGGGWPSSAGNSMLTCQRIAQIANHIQHQLLDIKDVEHCEIVDAEQHGQRTICIIKMKTARTDMSIGIVLKRKKVSSNNTLLDQQMLTINTHKITQTHNRTQSQSHNHSDTVTYNDTNCQTQTAHTDRIGKQNTKPLDNRSNTTTTDTIEERKGTY